MEFLELDAKLTALMATTLSAPLSASLAMITAKHAQDPQPTVIPAIQAQLSHI